MPKETREKFLNLSLQSTRKSYYPELKKQLEIAKKNERYMKLLIDNLPALISYIDKNEHHVFVNLQYEKALGLKRSDIIGKSRREVLGEEYIKFSERHVSRVMAGERVNFEAFVPGVSGEQRLHEVNYIPDIDSENRVNGFYVLAQDIDEKRRSEEERYKLENQLRQSQKLESIGTLAGGIAHDFNNILSPILMNSEMCMMDLPDGSPFKESLNDIYNAGERAKELVKQILAFSRKGGEEKILMKISPIVKEAVNFLRAMIPSTIEIQQYLNIKNDTVFASPTQISQILINLGANAAHAMKENGGILAISLDFIDHDKTFEVPHLYLKPGKYLKLTVSDTGSGIDSSIIEKIFDPYFTTKAPGEGTGIGLSIVHGIVKSYGGDIAVKSRPGEGCTFELFFPHAEGTESERPGLNQEIKKGTERILLVDDETVIVKITEAMLEKLGYSIVSKTNSLEALELFSNSPGDFDLVITDQTMPRMTGKVLAKKIIDIRPDIPIILCTGYSEYIDTKTANGCGISAFIMKPVTMWNLSGIIRETLDNKRKNK